jgi:hypothetical protein
LLKKGCSKKQIEAWNDVLFMVSGLESYHTKQLDQYLKEEKIWAKMLAIVFQKKEKALEEVVALLLLKKMA